MWDLKKMEEWATIRQIHYHVTEVDEKKVHRNLTYQLTSLRLSKTNSMMRSGLHGH